MKINFSCEERLQGVLPEPKAALKFAPDYFKSINPQTDNNPKNGTVKRCVPFLDALSSGFIIPLWADMWVLAKDGDITIEFPEHFPQAETLGQHSYSQIVGHPLKDTTYGKLPMKFVNPWMVETDKGVSCLFTSPLNHLETRFKILDGVVDTDTYYNNVNFPFLWTGGDGEFIIPRGTPLVQVIPFRREETDFTIGTIEVEKRSRTQDILGTKLKNGYRDEFWNKANKKIKTPVLPIKEELRTDFFEDGYTVLRSVISSEESREYSQRVFDASYDSDLVFIGDDLCPKSKSIYGCFDDLFEKLTPLACAKTKKNLIPSFSYARLYKKGDDLQIHRDRNSCEYSITLCLGMSGNPWPIYMARHSDKTTSHPYQDNHGNSGFMEQPSAVSLEVRDAVLYKGHEMVHWREPLESEWQTQAFFFWVDAEGQHAEFKYDKRPGLNIPSKTETT